MKRKIDLFWYWFIFVVAFVFCFYCVVFHSKNVNAYFLNSDGNIQSDNLVPNDSYQFECYKMNYTTCVLDEGISITSNFDTSLTNVTAYTYITKDLSQYIDDIGLYRVTVFTENNLIPNRVCIFGNSSSQSLGCTYNSTSHVFTINDNNINQIKRIVIYNTADGGGVPYSSITITNFMITKGDSVYSDYFPYEVWYNENLVGDLSKGVIGIDSALLTYEDGATGTTVTYGDVSFLIKNTFGTLYFDEVWKMLDNYAIDGYENAFIDIKFKDRLDITTKYIITTSRDNYGSGVVFYQDNVEMLSVLNLFNVKDQYCDGAPSFSCYVQLNNYVNVVQPGINSSNAFSYLNRIKVWSDSVDMQTLTFGFENISYSQGYNSGYNAGYSVGDLNGKSVGYDFGYNSGYLYGYEKGVDAVEGSNNTLVGLVGGILTAPVNMLKTIFDFEFLGINLTHFIFSIVSLFIVIWLIKVFL